MAYRVPMYPPQVYKDLIISTIVDAPLLAFFKAYRL